MRITKQEWAEDKAINTTQLPFKCYSSTDFHDSNMLFEGHVSLSGRDVLFGHVSSKETHLEGIPYSYLS